MSAFRNVPEAPADPILGLTEAFKADSNPDKINLGVGVFVDDHGKTPTLNCVREAEKRLVQADVSKSYLPMTGNPAYCGFVQGLLMGGELSRLQDRLVTAQTPGGTGGLRVAGDLLADQLSGATLWMSDPTWPNHPKVFDAAGVSQRTYRYFDGNKNGLDFEGMLEDLSEAPAGDVVLLHASCHNPTGVDPTPEQWTKIARLLTERELMPLIDFAYQGFARGLDDDAEGLRILLEHVPAAIVCSSFSKNFGLYGERVGAITFVCENPDEADKVASQVKSVIRRNYSNPPMHGAAIVETILADADLTGQWRQELAGMRDRINSMRELFVQKLDEAGVPGDFEFLTRQWGMFSYSGLTKDQVNALRADHHIYIVGSGRINVAGITTGNVERLAAAIKSVS